MVKPLQLLLVEDSENDELLLLRELKRSGYDIACERVYTAPDLKAALARQEWDIIISDFVMPQFSGLEALKIVKEKGVNIPVIIMSGKISDETAVLAMKAGASDYIMKDNLTRLGPSIEREIHETAMRVENEKAAAQLKEKEDELRSLKNINQLKDEFVGLVSHELRTPLTIILGALNTVMTEDNKLSRKEIKQLIGDAYYEAETLSDILSNLLELARAQANRLHINEEPLDMCEIIDNVIKNMRPAIPSNRLVLTCDKSITVNADRIRLQRIIHNLLDNALKYSEPGTKIEIFSVRKENNVHVGVRDHGVGIPQELQKKLFEPFSRLENENIKASGTGLGLVVCQRLVEAHGGRLWVESQLGQGSTFQFTLPLPDLSANNA
jgi:two-component system sensor histidine kinase EvgS